MFRTLFDIPSHVISTWQYRLIEQDIMKKNRTTQDAWRYQCKAEIANREMGTEFLIQEIRPSGTQFSNHFVSM
jgi:hypothetical protein